MSPALSGLPGCRDTTLDIKELQVSTELVPVIGAEIQGSTEGVGEWGGGPG